MEPPARLRGRYPGVGPYISAQAATPTTVASVSLERTLDLGHETLQSLGPRSGTVCRLDAQSIGIFGETETALVSVL